MQSFMTCVMKISKREQSSDLRRSLISWTSWPGIASAALKKWPRSSTPSMTKESLNTCKQCSTWSYNAPASTQNWWRTILPSRSKTYRRVWNLTKKHATSSTITRKPIKCPAMPIWKRNWSRKLKSATKWSNWSRRRLTCSIRRCKNI